MECDIMVTVNCSDQSIEIKLKKLLKYEYFKKMLTFGSTKMFSEKKQAHENDRQYTEYSFKIPHIGVDCSSDVFLYLLRSHVNIYSFTNLEKLLSLMIYIDMYQMPTYIQFRNGFAVKDHFHFVEYVKNQLPHLNPFEIIQKGNFSVSTCFQKHGFKLLSENKLNSNLVKNLFEYLDEYTTKKYDCYWCPDIQIDVIKSIKVFKEFLPIETKNLITTKRIANMINRYLTECHGFCTGNYRHNYVTRYSNDIDAMFVEFTILHDLGLIDMAELGSPEKYKIYR